ncbi:MAG: L-2-amino-thiazoline-4-carboxylic acid hydrolase [Candidatus Bathyarchaeia archaeon]|jgi:hypothetical protein
MTATNEGAIPLEEAKKEVEISTRRLALLHLSYAKTLIQELGEEKGKRLIMKAIKDYGACIGKRTRKEIVDQKLEASPENFGKGNYLRVPKLGHHDRGETCEVNGEKRTRVYGCAMDKLWKEYGEEKLGRLYCYVDPAKYMAYNSRYKLIHIKALPDGDDCCEMAVRLTTEKERKDFLSKDKDWSYLDGKKSIRIRERKR